MRVSINVLKILRVSFDFSVGMKSIVYWILNLIEGVLLLEYTFCSFALSRWLFTFLFVCEELLFLETFVRTLFVWECLTLNLVLKWENFCWRPAIFRKFARSKLWLLLRIYPNFFMKFYVIIPHSPWLKIFYLIRIFVYIYALQNSTKYKFSGQ